MNTVSDISIIPPDLDWTNAGGLVSKQFGDIYVSTLDGALESQRVFACGIGAPDIWKDKTTFSIGEIGFGTGLNFLTTWSEWEKSAPDGAILSYVAVEGFPLCAGDLSRALEPFPELAAYSRQLIDVYPDPHPGFHQVILFGGRVKLLLLFGPVSDMLGRLVGQMDAWYLDGFKPSKNPDMWSPTVLTKIAERARRGATIATFTTAGQVRRDLEYLGFELEKMPRHGHKRDCLRGYYSGPALRPIMPPWYDMLEPMASDVRIAIIGAGVAGGALAHALKLTKAQVTVYDRGVGPAAGASGNPLALLQPRPADPRQPFARFQSAAYLHMIRVLESLPNEASVWKGGRGVISFARDADFLKRYKTWVRSGTLPEAHARILDDDEVERFCGISIGQGGVYFPSAGTIDPAAVCHALLAGTDCQFDTQIETLRRAGAGWELMSNDGSVLAEADIVLLANGVEATSLSPDCDLALYAKRGQISLVETGEQGLKLGVGLSYGGYLTAASSDRGHHVLGATYQRCPNWNDPSWRELSAADNQENIDLLAGRSDKLKALLGATVVGGRASLRTTTEDHAPVIGALFSDEAYRDAYGDLHHGKPHKKYPSAATLTGPEGLYVMTAFGSRGFALASLAAEILVAEIFGLPIPAEKAVIEAIHPARFLVRSLKRR